MSGCSTRGGERRSWCRRRWWCCRRRALLRLDVERTLRRLIGLCHHATRHIQLRQRPLDQTHRVRQKHPRLFCRHLRSLRRGSVSQRLEIVVVQNVDASMIRTEVIHLLAPHRRPDFLADELEHVEGVCEARSFAREVFGHVVADVIADTFESCYEERFDLAERFGRLDAGYGADGFAVW